MPSELARSPSTQVADAETEATADFKLAVPEPLVTATAAAMDAVQEWSRAAEPLLAAIGALERARGDVARLQRRLANSVLV